MLKPCRRTRWNSERWQNNNLFNFDFNLNDWRCDERRKWLFDRTRIVIVCFSAQQHEFSTAMRNFWSEKSAAPQCELAIIVQSQSAHRLPVIGQHLAIDRVPSPRTHTHRVRQSGSASRHYWFYFYSYVVGDCRHIRIEKTRRRLQQGIQRN